VTTRTVPDRLPAGAVAERVAARVADPATLARAVAAESRQSRYAEVLPWRPAGLAKGHAGVAVLCAALDRRDPGNGWDRAGHHHLETAASGATPYDQSLYSGLAGLGFAAVLLAAGRPRYARLLRTVDATLAPTVSRVARRLATVDGCAAADLDLVSGLTGVCAYLLARTGTAGDGAPARRCLEEGLSGLARLLTRPGNPRAWHTPAHLTGGSLRETFPNGHHNCGLAHGVPGPLAVLSLALADGVEVPEAAAAVESAGAWVAEHTVGTADDPDWPDAVALDEPATTGALPEPRPGRAAWCYGTPGVARSLWLAGVAVDRPEWRDLAARAIRAVARRPPEAWWLSTPAFCHGRAGLLQVLRRFAVDLGDPVVASAADTLAAALAGEYDPDTVLGIRSVEPGDRLVDHPGLLDGAPGVALALLGAANDRADAGAAGGDPAWDRMFLLS